MKAIIILFMFLIARPAHDGEFYLAISDPSAEWLTDFSFAQREASQSGKTILLNFSGSDWCGPCINLKKQIFDSDVFSSYAAAHLLLVNADFPRLKKNKLSAEQTKQNEELAERYNKEGAFPYTVLIKPDGTVLKEWSGLPGGSADKFVQEIKNVTHAGNSN